MNYLSLKLPKIENSQHNLNPNMSPNPSPLMMQHWLSFNCGVSGLKSAGKERLLLSDLSRQYQVKSDYWFDYFYVFLLSNWSWSHWVDLFAILACETWSYDRAVKLKTNLRKKPKKTISRASRMDCRTTAQTDSGLKPSRKRSQATPSNMQLEWAFFAKSSPKVFLPTSFQSLQSLSSFQLSRFLFYSQKNP